MPKQTKTAAAATKKTTPKERKDKALKAQKAIKKGSHSKGKKSIRTSVHFHLPKTLKQQRAPKYPRASVPTKSILTQARACVLTLLRRPFPLHFLTSLDSPAPSIFF